MQLLQVAAWHPTSAQSYFCVFHNSNKKDGAEVDGRDSAGAQSCFCLGLAVERDCSVAACGPPALEQLIEQCTMDDADLRLQIMSEVLERIQSVSTSATASSSVKVWTAQSRSRQELCERANKFPFTFCRPMVLKSRLL